MAFDSIDTVVAPQAKAQQRDSETNEDEK